MAFHRLTASIHEGDLHENVPWGNKYVKLPGADLSPFPIRYVVEYDSGLMVVCNHHKSYLHAGSKDHADLLEAVQVFAADKLPEHMLYVELNKKGKPSILRNDEEQCSYWHKTESRYVQVFNAAPAKEDAIAENPLLAGRGVQKKARSRKQGEVDREPTKAP